MSFTVLLAEDDRFLRRAAEVALKGRGLAVITAADGVEAIEKARSARPDLILLDLVMPRMTGLEVLQALKQDEATCGLRVLVLSNSTRELETHGVDKLGVVGYWIKANVSLKELGSRVLALLEEAVPAETGSAG